MVFVQCFVWLCSSRFGVASILTTVLQLRCFLQKWGAWEFVHHDRIFLSWLEVANLCSQGLVELQGNVRAWGLRLQFHLPPPTWNAEALASRTLSLSKVGQRYRQKGCRGTIKKVAVELPRSSRQACSVRSESGYLRYS